MAVQAEVIQNIEANFQVDEKTADYISVEVDMGEGRSQLVFTTFNDDQLVITSAFANKDSMTAMQALEIADSSPFGIRFLFNHYYAVTTALPINNVDWVGIHSTIIFVAAVADSLEENYVGGDSL